jgi:hypothetical protein
MPNVPATTPRGKNLVQVEFFHVQGETLEDVFSQCAEKVADGLELVLQGLSASNGIKTVVRFFDDGPMTEFVQLSSTTEKRKEELIALYQQTRGLRRVLTRIQLRTVILSRNMQTKRRVGIAAYWLQQAIEKRSPIAIEIEEHRFREARPDELHELYESAKAAKNAWIFVFEPNQLLSDKNKYITYIM